MTKRIGQPIAQASGRKFWPLDPRTEDVHLEDIVLALSQMCRWGGRTARWYSVAQHSVWVARRVATTHPHLVLQALLHDAAEAYVGDQVRPIKSSLAIREPRGYVSFDVVENRIHATILRALGVRPANSGEWATIMAADEEALATEARDLLNGQQILSSAAPVGNRLASWQPSRARDEFWSVWRANARPDERPPLRPDQFIRRHGCITSDRSSD